MNISIQLRFLIARIEEGTYIVIIGISRLDISPDKCVITSGPFSIRLFENLSLKYYTASICLHWFPRILRNSMLLGEFTEKS